MSTWQPCPRCHSSRVEIHGKWHTFGQGFALIIVGVPLTMLVLSFFMGGFAFLFAGMLAVVGLLMMVGAPVMPSTGQCKDCKKSWTVSKAA